MSLRQESLRAYRRLYRAVSMASRDCGLYNQTGLGQYINVRFGQQATNNKQQLNNAMRTLDENAASQRSGAKRGVKGARHRLAQIQRQREKVLQQYQAYVSQQIDDTRALADAIPHATGNAALTSVLQVLSAGVGNDAYQALMERNFRAFFDFEQRQEARHEATEEATSERQNRIMQQAVLPYGQRLLLAHRTAIGPNNTQSALSYLTSWQVAEAIVETRSHVTAHHFQLGRDHVVVEVDETYNKQVIYICCTRGDNMDSGSYDWSLDVERVEVSESEEVPKALFHSDYLLTASRLCDALTQETPIHPTRKTVIVGHGVGGAVAFIVGLILAQRGFEMSNTIMFGAPKAALRGTLRERDVAALNPLRIVLAGDPLPELPVTGSEGTPFAQVGEVLVMTPSTYREGPGDESNQGEAEESEEEEEPVRKSRGWDAAQRQKSTGSTTDATPFTAEDLASSLFMDAEDEKTSEATAEQLADDRTDEPHETSSTSATSEPVPEDESVDSGSSFVFGELAENNYRAQFLVEHYVQHLSDSDVTLAYAEHEDDVWDEGDYAQMRSDAARTSV